jgi:pimeloyl-ACP methyl ester carboxylesterase
MTAGPVPPPATCPIGWQPQAFAPVFFGARTLGPAEGAPVPLRIFFPSLDGAVETAPLLAGCGRHPLVVFCHGHCQGDTDHFRRWFRLPAQLARAGYVVVVPQLAGNAGGSSPSVPGHPDLPTLDAVIAWARSGWDGTEVLQPSPATGLVGHSFGAGLAAVYAVDHPDVSAFAGLSGPWGDWFGGVPFPLPRLDLPTLLTWGGVGDSFTQLSDAQWEQLRRPRHRVVFTEGEHWDYLPEAPDAPCNHGFGPCHSAGAASHDLVTMFLARYLPPELATDLPPRVPDTLAPPASWRDGLTFQQEFFAGGYLNGWEALDGDDCGVEVSSATERLLANTRTRETHSVEHPCSWVDQISPRHKWFVGARPTGYHWCDFCFPSRADG